jgi:chaperone BCS1
MTMNHPEKFDRALRQTSTELTNAPAAKKTTISSESRPQKKDEDSKLMQLFERSPILEVVEPEDLKITAKQFAEQIPEKTFSPADIQGFPPTMEKQPSRTLKEVGKWRDDLLDRKRKAGQEEKEENV